MTHWMHISAQLNLIHQTPTSRLVCNYYAMDKTVDCPFKLAHPFLKMYILKLTKLLVPSAHLDRNGVTLLLKHKHKGHQIPSTVGEAG
jgi:hypothetical protein